MDLLNLIKKRRMNGYAKDELKHKNDIWVEKVASLL